MGIFHYELVAIPNEFIATRPETVGAIVVQASIESDDIWQRQPGSEFLAALRSLLPTNRSWGPCEEYASQGVYASDLRIWRNEAGLIDSVKFRYSPVGDSIEVLTAFLDVLRSFSCVVLSCDSERVLAPTAAAVLPDLAASRAARFVRNPTAVLLECAEAREQP